MGDRVQLSKKLRFDIFKRDEFVCQYCGRHPPAVVLEIDHINPVSDGGSNDEHNLITSCFDCNRGKADGSLTATPIDVAGKAELLTERLAQAKAYDDLLMERRTRQDEATDLIIAIYQSHFDGWTLKDGTRPSIRTFLEKLPFLEVSDAMELACNRMVRDRAFKYFCGVCWRKIKGD